MLFSCNGSASSGDSASYHDGGLSKTEFYATRGDSVFFYGQLQDVISKFEPSTPVNRRMTETGMAFIGKPYVASTLEKEGEEQLVINLLEVDCTTFVEYVTSLVICSVKDMGPSFTRIPKLG